MPAITESTSEIGCVAIPVAGGWGLGQSADNPVRLSDPQWQQLLSAEDRRSLTPLIYGHINLNGTFYLDRSKRLNPK